jgi:hypothetical protein
LPFAFSENEPEGANLKTMKPEKLPFWVFGFEFIPCTHETGPRMAKQPND